MKKGYKQKMRLYRFCVLFVVLFFIVHVLIVWANRQAVPDLNFAH